MAAGDGGRVLESGGAREGRVVDSSGPLVRETSARLENLSGEGRQASLTGSYPGFRVAGQAPVEDLPRRDGQRGEYGTIRGFDPVRDSVAMFGFGKGDLKPTIPVFNGKQQPFSRWKQESVIYSRRYGFGKGNFKPTIPVFNNSKQQPFSRWKQESVIHSRRYRFDAVFTRAEESQDVNVGDPYCPVERLQDEFGVDIVISHLHTRQYVSSTLKSEKNGTTFFIR